MPEIQFSAASLLVSLAVGFLSAFFFYRKLNKKIYFIPKNVRKILVFLRFVGIFFLIWFLFEIYFVFFKNQIVGRQNVVLFDFSQSMKNSNPDVFDLYQKIMQRFTKEKQNQNIKTFFFGNQIVASDTAMRSYFPKTDITLALERVSTLFEENGCNVLLVTDGIWNSGTDPLYENFPGIKSLQIIGIGDSTVYPDAGIRDIRVPQRCNPGESVGAEVQLFSRNMKGKKARFVVREGGTLIYEKKIIFNSDVFSENLTFEMPVKLGGIHTYKAELICDEQERNVQNNQRWFNIMAEDASHLLLFLYGRVSPDIGAIREVISKYKDYSVKMFSIDEWNREISKIPSAVIIYGAENKTSELYQFFSSKNIPVWFLCPELSFKGHSLQIQNILPGQFYDAEPVINEAFDYFLISQDHKEKFKCYPAVMAPAGIYRAGTGVVLFNQRVNSVENGLPLWIYEKEKPGLKRVWVLCDGIWKWKMFEKRKYNSSEAFDDLILKTLQFLTVDQHRKRFHMEFEKKLNEFEDAIFTAEYLNENLEPDVSGEVKLTLKDSTGKIFDYLMNVENLKYRLNVGKLPPGKYSVSVQTVRNKDVYQDAGVFVVIPHRPELSDLRARFPELRLLAARHGGNFYHAHNYQKAIDEWLSEKHQVGHLEVEEVREPPVHLKFFFFLILVMFVSEWVILKYYGYI
ncbi:MAG: VWA domain-containing protein [Bacteroidia bacterium]|nr:VWA domain-containing protein [Bacteroidia bacterium]